MLTLNDGRAELWQWDTGRTLAVDSDCSQVHFSNKVFGRSIDVDVVDGAAIIPDILLQTDKDLNVWAFVGTAENGYTKISKTFKINRRNKPADYVFTPTDQMTLQTIQSQIGDLADLTTEAKYTLVAAINEAARTGGGAGSMELRVADGYVQYSRDGGSTWENLIAMADLKGDPGTDGKDGHSPVVTATKSGKTTTISVDGTAIATVEDGADGAPGSRGADGITPTIGSNGNWYLGATDTGKPSRGADGATGATGEKGTDGKSAYAYAVDGGYTGTEAEFAAKLASGALIVTLTDSTDSSSDWLADKSYNDIRDAILSGIPVYVFNGEQYLPLAVVTDVSLFFGRAMGINDETGAGVFTILIEITNDDKVKNAGNYVEIPTTLPNPNALTFTGAVTGSYDGSAPLSVEIPSGGGSGSDISLGLTGAAAGQIAKITAVDDTGKPTAWAPVDMPSGGGDETNFQLVFNQECVLDADVSQYEVNIDFGLQNFKEFIALIEYSASTNDVYQGSINFDGVIIESFGGATIKGDALHRVIYAKRVTQTEYMGIHRSGGNPFDWSGSNMISTLSYFSNRIKTPTGKLVIWRNKSTEAATITIKLYKR